MQTKNEKNISHTLRPAEDDLNIKEKPKRITVAVYCRVGRTEQLSESMQIEKVLEEKSKVYLRMNYK